MVRLLAGHHPIALPFPSISFHRLPFPSTAFRFLPPPSIAFHFPRRCVFWLVTTLGYDGSLGTGGAAGQCIVAAALLSGLILTTMPITVIGEAFGNAWQRRELLVLEMRVQDLLVRRGISVRDFKVIFDELDRDHRLPPPSLPFPSISFHFLPFPSMSFHFLRR